MDNVHVTMDMQVQIAQFQPAAMMHVQTFACETCNQHNVSFAKASASLWQIIWSLADMIH